MVQNMHERMTAALVEQLGVHYGFVDAPECRADLESFVDALLDALVEPHPVLAPSWWPTSEGRDDASR